MSTQNLFFKFENYTFNPELTRLGYSYDSKNEEIRNISIIDVTDALSFEKESFNKLYSRLLVLETAEAINKLTKADLGLNVKSASYKVNAKYKSASSSFKSSKSITLAVEFFYVSECKRIRANATKSSEYNEFLDSLSTPNSTVDPLSFYDQFGDFIVSAVYYGTRIIVFLTLDTENETEKNEVVASLNASYNGLAVSGNLTSKFEETFDKCKSERKVEVTIIGQGNYNPIAASKIQVQANNGELSSKEILNSINDLIKSSFESNGNESSNNTDEVAIFSKLENAKTIALDPKIPRLDDYTIEVLPLWERIQSYEWAINTVNDIQTGDDRRSIGMNQIELETLLAAREKWLTVRNALLDQYYKIPECIKAYSNIDARCFDVKIPSDTPRLSIIPAVPLYVLDSDVIYDTPEFSSYVSDDVSIGFNLFTVSNKGKGKPNEKYILTVALKWKTKGYEVYHRNPTMHYATEMNIIINNTQKSKLIDRQYKFDDEGIFNAITIDVEADSEGKCEAKLHLISLSNLYGNGYININLEFLKGSYMIIERRDRFLIF